MQLIEIRNEVLAKGFDPTLFGIARVNRYINDGYFLVCRRTEFYAEEGVLLFQTTPNVALKAFPADFGRLRAVEDVDRSIDLEAVELRDIDRSVPATGSPNFYAVDGANIHFYPTPDSATHNMRIRYWKLPTPLVGDTDVPILPDDWCHLLWRYGVKECYKSEDDLSTGMQWEQDFNNQLAMFMADQRNPNSDAPMQARGMWDESPILSPSGAWTLYGGW